MTQVHGKVKTWLQFSSWEGDTFPTDNTMRESRGQSQVTREHTL